MENYSRYSKPTQARRAKLAQNLTTAEHGPTPKRLPKSIARTFEITRGKQGGGLR